MQHEDAANISTDKRPIANALFIQNLNILKQKKRKKEKEQPIDFIGTMGLEVSIVEQAVEVENASASNKDSSMDSIKNSHNNRR